MPGIPYFVRWAIGLSLLINARNSPRPVRLTAAAQPRRELSYPKSRRRQRKESVNLCHCHILSKVSAPSANASVVSGLMRRTRHRAMIIFLRPLARKRIRWSPYRRDSTEAGNALLRRRIYKTGLSSRADQTCTQADHASAEAATLSIADGRKQLLAVERFFEQSVMT